MNDQLVIPAYHKTEEEERKEILRQYRALLRSLKSRIKPGDKELLRSAFEMAADAHKTMRRKSGEPYILHEVGSGNNAPVASQSSAIGRGGPSTGSTTSTLTVGAANWVPNQWASYTLQVTPNTTVAAASAGATLPQSTINVASTAGFPSSGQVLVQNQLVTY